MNRVKIRRPLWAIGIFTVALISLTACQAAGKNPDDVEIPVVQPTVDPSLCLNSTYPVDAPQLEDVSPDMLVLKESGIRVFDRTAGDGRKPTVLDLVVVKYTGWLSDGCIFASTYPRGQDAQFPVSSLIGGWQEAMVTMKTGGIRRVEIPSELAYRELGSPPNIPPHETLMFDIELINVLTLTEVRATATVVAASFTPTPEGGDTLPSCANAGPPGAVPRFADVAEDQLVAQPSGISVFDIKVGDGNSPGENDFVCVHYTGWLENGSEFDSSYPRGTAIGFPVSGVIQGFRDAILGMSVGGHRRVQIPSELGYGDSGAGASIPGGATLYFDIVLDSFIED